MSSTETTKKHFEVFKQEGEKWIERFGLNDWRVEFFHGAGNGEVPPRDARAFCAWKMEARCAGIHLAAMWPDEELTEKAIRRSAFHEVLHILLARIHCLAVMRFLDCSATIDEEVHTIIRRLESGIFNNEYKKQGKKR